MENPNTPTPSGMTPGAASAGSGQSPIRLVYGSLSVVPLDDLVAEIFRRDCCAVIITPSDLSEYWESDESGATHPGSATPTPEEMQAVRRGFEGWLDCGNFTEIMQVCRDAWNDAKKAVTAEAPRPWNGIDENTRDPLELDDDAPAQPSELDDAPTPRRFLVSWKMEACEEYTAPTPAAALAAAEASEDAPPLADFTASEGPEIVAEWDPVAEYWGDVRANGGESK